jgi:hypothetical protein
MNCRLRIRLLTTLLTVLLGATCHGQSSPAAQETGKLFLTQQEGIDKAETIWIEWDVDVDSTNAMKRSYLRTSSMFRGTTVTKEGSKTSSYDQHKNKGVMVTQKGPESSGAVIGSYGFFNANDSQFESLWIFFPSLRHFWKATPKHVLDDLRKNHPEQLIQGVSRILGPDVDVDRAYAFAMAEWTKTSSAATPPRVSIPPGSMATPGEGNMAIGCRTSQEGWFDILEFDMRTKRLVAMTTYVNKDHIPEEALHKRDNNPDTSEAELWGLQSTHARLFRRISYGDHRELPLGIVIPTVATLRSYSDDGKVESTNTYRVTKAEINTELGEKLSPAQIQDGTPVQDYSLDPAGAKHIEYVADSTRSLLEWKAILSKAQTNTESQ